MYKPIHMLHSVLKDEKHYLFVHVGCLLTQGKPNHDILYTPFAEKHCSAFPCRQNGNHLNILEAKPGLFIIISL